MFRFVICSNEESRWQGIASRLTGATIDSCIAADRCREIPQACDAVVFAGSQTLDKDVIERFLHAGKHVLLAAEPCLPWTDWESLRGAARQSQVQLAVVNPDRYLPSRQLIKQQLPDKLGPVGLVRIHRWEPSPMGGLTALGLPGPLIRDIDLTLWLAGKLPDRVFAFESLISQRTASTGQFVQVHLGFADGSMALIDYDSRLPSGDNFQSLTVVGSAGAAYADDHQNMQLVYRGGHPQAVRTAEGAKLLAAMVQEFVDALCAGSDLSERVAAWRDVLKVVDAIRQSLTSRQAVHLEGG